MASGTITGSFSGGTWSSKWEFKVDWSSAAKTGTTNKSTITMVFKVRVTGSGTYTTHQNSDTLTVKIDGSQVYSEPAGFNQNGSTLTNNTWYTLQTVTTDVTHGSDGKKTCTISATFNLSKTTAGTGSLSGSMVLDTLMSACSAPTSITMTKNSNSVSSGSTVVPSGTFILSWSGASGGTNNAIKGYKIYWKIGSAPTTSSYGGIIDQSSNTTPTYTFSSAGTRGSTYYYKIVTVGTVSGLDSAISSTEYHYTVNALPSAPSSSISSQTITSTTSSLSTTITAGASNTGASGRDVYQSTNGGTTKTKVTLSNYQASVSLISNTTNPAQGSSITYSFYTYDGLEYSSATTVTITRNKKPSFSWSSDSGGPIVGGSSYTAKGATYYKTLTVKGKANKSCNAVIKIYKGGSSSSITTLIKTDTVAATESSNSVNKTYNLLTLLDNTTITSENDIYLKVTVTPEDATTGSWKETGDSQTRNYYGTSSSNYIRFPGAPPEESISIKDTFNEESAILSGYCYKEICFHFLDDGAMTATPSVTIQNTTSGGSIGCTVSSSVTNSIRCLNVLMKSVPNGGDLLRVTVTLQESNIKKTFYREITELRTPELGSLDFAAGMVNNSVNIYSSTSDIRLTCIAPCAFSSDRPSSNNDYHITECYVRVSSPNGNNSRTIASDATDVSSVATAAGDTLAIQIPKTIFVNFGDFGKTEYNGTSPAYAQIIFKNVYNNEIATGKSYTIDYYREPSINSITMKYQRPQTDSSSTWNNFNGTSGYKVQEGLKVKAIINYTAYSNSTLTAKLYYTIDDTNYVYVGEQPAVIGNQTSGHTSEIEILHGQDGIIPLITTTNNWKWKVELTNTANTQSLKTSTSDAISAVRQEVPTITSLYMDTPAYSRTNGVTKFEISSFKVSEVNTNLPAYSSGLSSYYTTTFVLYNVSTGQATTSVFSPNQLDGKTYTGEQTDTDTTEWDVKSIQAACIITCHQNGHEVQKVAYSNIITIYTSQPTVAYRVNQLGINTSTPDSASLGAIIDVHPATNKNIILLQTTTQGSYLKIDLVNATIDII